MDVVVSLECDAVVGVVEDAALVHVVDLRLGLSGGEWGIDEGDVWKVVGPLLRAEWCGEVAIHCIFGCGVQLEQCRIADEGHHDTLSQHRCISLCYTLGGGGWVGWGLT